MKDQYMLVVDNHIMKLAVDFYTGFPNLHLTFKVTPSHNLVKYVRDVMKEELFIILGMHGYDTAFVIINDYDEKLLRFCKLMGFEEEKRDRGFVFMAQDII